MSNRLQNTFNKATNELSKALGNPTGFKVNSNGKEWPQVSSGDFITTSSGRIISKKGFLPINYEYSKTITQSIGTNNIKNFKKGNTVNFLRRDRNNEPDTFGEVDERSRNINNNERIDVKFSDEDIINDFKWNSHTNNYDNEDPIYYTFEVKIKNTSSPLFNGEIDKFIKKFSDLDDIKHLENILNQFKFEIVKYFRFDTYEKDNAKLNYSNILGTSDKKKLFYLKSLSGLDTIYEKNTGGTNKPFADWLTDKVILTFYEDTSLNLGTLYALYKKLYWHRNKGKNIIPENLLRFDCEITICEVRNFLRLKREINKIDFNLKKIDNTESFKNINYSNNDTNSIDNSDFTKSLKANLSKYVYTLYECQLFFPNPSHPISIDIGTKLSPSDSYSIDLYFKHSNMDFKRFNYKDNKYYSITNNKNRIIVEKDERKIIYEGSKIIKEEFVDLDNQIIGDYNYENRKRIINENGIVDIEEGRKNRNELFKNASNNALNSIKDAGLREGQRRINYQALLLNETLDRIRNQVGLGRMSSPTNIYEQSLSQQGNQFFFDVRNALRDFGGDSLDALFF
jgi:hypothetical protein